MAKSVPALSAVIVTNFCVLCDKAHEYWANHLELFDKNPRNNELFASLAGTEWERLSIISQEHGLLQIIKLHDKAVMNGNVTLGIEYVLTYGGWSDSTRASLEVLAADLRSFAKQLLSARNKLLSHNDLAAMLEGTTLGAFPDGEDEKYFRSLQEFVNIVHNEVIGGPYPFNDLVKNDVAFFLHAVKQQQ